ncbi:MAG: lytic murein transglycosylase [Rhizobiales bacterium]|nr:lytic murein transglycosylase [Hyphomicrobiales bacterium]
MRALIASLAIAFSSSAALAATCGDTASGFEPFVAGVKKEAAAAGVSKRSIAVLDTVSYDMAIIKRDRAQNIFSDSFLAFQKKMISAGRLQRAKDKIVQNKALFDKVQKQYGVPPAVIAAFWALETDFGAVTGDYPTIQSLATLAWDCRRPEKFRPQLIASLQLLDRGDLTLAEFKGAWAGEIGQTQFMAYDYNESAVDYDGDGKRDLRNSVPDVLASTANLLRKHGWQPNQPWLQEVKVPADLPWKEADIAIQHPRSQWSEWGVTAVSGNPIKADGMKASLLLPMGRNGPAFLAYSNFTRAYLKWNESLVYSTTAAYLATRIAGAEPVHPGRATVNHPSYEQIVQLQTKLAKLGYDVGKIDGKIGKGTRYAVKDQQIKLSLPADSYPSQEVIAQILKSTHKGHIPASMLDDGSQASAPVKMQTAPVETVAEESPAVTAPVKPVKPAKPAKKKAIILPESADEGNSLY